MIRSPCKHPRQHLYWDRWINKRSGPSKDRNSWWLGWEKCRDCHSRRKRYWNGRDNLSVSKLPFWTSPRRYRYGMDWQTYDMPDRLRKIQDRRTKSRFRPARVESGKLILKI